MPTLTSGPDDDPAQAVVVWLAQLPQVRASLPALESLLDEGERERAAKFRFPEDRARFVAGRGLLRLGLRRYAPQLPATIELVYSNLGRPQIPGNEDAPQFSISHTRDLVALAFSNNARTGIDLEFMQATVDLQELAERIMSEEDFATFNALPTREKQLVFYRVWTRKEAYLKARGEGIATGLRDVSVSFTAEATTSMTDRRDPGSTAWRLHRLPLPADYVGCVACDEPERPVACFTARVENGDVRLSRS